MTLRKFFPLLMLFIACDEPKFPPPHPDEVSDDIFACYPAYVNLERLGCREGKPTKKGVTFYDLCRELEGKRIFLNARCLSKIESCDQVDVCTGSK